MAPFRRRRAVNGRFQSDPRAVAISTVKTMTEPAELAPLKPVALVYTGEPRGVSLLAYLLQQEGLTAEYNPPREYKDAIVHEAVVHLLVSVADGTVGVVVDVAIRTAIANFRRRWDQPASIERAPSTPARPVEDRLGELEGYRDRGTITAEEYARRRTAIVDEIGAP